MRLGESVVITASNKCQHYISFNISFLDYCTSHPVSTTTTLIPHNFIYSFKLIGCLMALQKKAKKDSQKKKL